MRWPWDFRHAMKSRKGSAWLSASGQGDEPMPRRKTVKSPTLEFRTGYASAREQAAKRLVEIQEEIRMIQALLEAYQATVSSGARRQRATTRLRKSS